MKINNKQQTIRGMNFINSRAETSRAETSRAEVVVGPKRLGPGAEVVSGPKRLGPNL